MARNTSITLGDHFDSFIAGQIQSGRFNNASEVIREGLRELEEREIKLKILREKLAIGEEQTLRGQFVDYSYESLITKLDQELGS